MYSNKELKGRVDQNYAKIGFERVTLLKFSNLHDFAYEAHFPPFGQQIIALKSFALLPGGYFALKNYLKNTT